VVRLFKNVIKANITQRRTSIRVSRERTVTLPPKDVYKTNIIRDNALNHYSESRKDSAGSGLTINDQGERKDHCITKD